MSITYYDTIAVAAITGVNGSGLLSGLWKTNFTPTQGSDITNLSYVTGISGALQTTIDTISGLSINQLTGYSVTGSSNFGGLLTIFQAGNVFTQLSGTRLYISGDTGAYASFASAANLQTTGSNLQAQVNTLTTNLGATGSNLYGYITNLSGAFNTTGNNLNSKIDSLSGFTTGNYSTVKVTGGSIISVANFSGISGISVTNSGQFVYISGDTTVLANVGNLAATGSNLQGQTNTLTTNLGSSGSVLNTKINNLSGFVTSNAVFVTGNQTVGGNKTFSGNHFLFDIYPSGAGYTGVSGLVFQTGVSGRFYFNDTGNQVSIDVNNRILSGNWNANNLNLSGNPVATAANLQSTGSNLQGQVNTLTTNLGTTGSNLQNQINANSGNLVNGDFGIIRTTGTQTFIDKKTFSGLMVFDNASGKFLYPSGATTPAIDLVNKIISGNWSTNTTSTLATHVVNYGALTGVSGAITNVSKRPSEIAGLSLWLVASDFANSWTGASVPASGTFIDSIKPRVKPPFATTSASFSEVTNKPIYMTGVQNGKDSILFDGVNDILSDEFYSWEGYTNVIEHTIFAVIKPTNTSSVTFESTSAYNYPQIVCGTSQYHGIGISKSVTTNNNVITAWGYQVTQGGTLGKVSTGEIVPNTTALITSWHESGTLSLSINESGIATTPFKNELIAGSVLRFGGVAAFYSGHLLDFSIFNRSLTAAERRSVSSYLRNEYNI